MNQEAEDELKLFLNACGQIEKETDLGISLQENLAGIEDSIQTMDEKILALKSQNLSTEVAELLKNHLFYLKYKILEKE